MKYYLRIYHCGKAVINKCQMQLPNYSISYDHLTDDIYAEVTAEEYTFLKLKYSSIVLLAKYINYPEMTVFDICLNPELEIERLQDLRPVE